MNQMIKIQNQEIQVKEFNGQRVVTFKDVAKVHEVDFENVKRNFNRNKQHFIEGIDFFSVSRKEFRDKLSPNEKLIGNPNVKMILLTESGYLMVVKSLTDDLAWKVQRQLVNCYFKVKELEQIELEETVLTLKDRIKVMEILSNSSQYVLPYVLELAKPFLSDDMIPVPASSVSTYRMKISSDFADRLLGLLHKNGMTQEELAKATGIYKSSISQYCNNKVKPKPEKLIKIAETLNVNTDYFYE